MNSTSMLFRDGGPWMYLILALAVLALLAALVAGVLHGLRMRGLSVVWITPLGGIVAVGAVGVLSGMGLATDAVASAAPEVRQTMLAMGISVSLYTDAFARLCAVVLGPLLAFSVAIGHLVSVRGDRGEWTPIPGAAAGVLAFLGLCVSGFLAGIRLAEGYSSAIILVGVLIAALALPCLVAVGVRSEIDEDKRAGTASARFVVWIALVFAAWGAAGLPEVSGTVVAFKAVATAAPEQKAEMMQAGLEYAAADGRTGLGTLGAILLAGLPLLLPLAGSVKASKLAAVGLALNVLFLGAVGGLVMMAGGTVADAMLTIGETPDEPAEMAPGAGTESLDLGG